MYRRWLLNDDECVSGGIVLAVKGCCSLRHVVKGGTDETAKQLAHVKFPTPRSLSAGQAVIWHLLLTGLSLSYRLWLTCTTKIEEGDTWSDYVARRRQTPFHRYLSSVLQQFDQAHRRRLSEDPHEVSPLASKRPRVTP